MTGIISPNEAIWKHQRRFPLSVFRSFGVGKRSFEDLIAKEADCLSEEFSALNGDEFDPKYYLMNATSNIICSIIFGDRFDYNDEAFKQILKVLDRRVQVVGSGSLSVFIPLLDLLSQAGNKALNLLKESVAYYKPIVETHKIRFAETKECNDLIDLYLQEIEKNRRKRDIESVDYIDEPHLLAMVDGLFIAGTETSSNTLAWCLLYVANYPDIQRRIQDEIEAVCGERLPTYDDQDSMPYTYAVILELQRLHTVVPLGNVFFFVI